MGTHCQVVRLQSKGMNVIYLFPRFQTIKTHKQYRCIMLSYTREEWFSTTCRVLCMFWYLPRCWFQICVLFTPKIGQDSHFDYVVIFFQRGWFNHQPDSWEQQKWYLDLSILDFHSLIFLVVGPSKGFRPPVGTLRKAWWIVWMMIDPLVWSILPGVEEPWTILVFFKVQNIWDTVDGNQKSGKLTNWAW